MSPSHHPLSPLSSSLPLSPLLQQDRSDTIDLETDTSLQVDISDALSEQEKVKFTVHTKVRQRREGERKEGREEGGREGTEGRVRGGGGGGGGRVG